MKLRILLFSLITSGVWAQVAEVPKPETVVATIDGKKVTYGELDAYLSTLGPEAKQTALSNRKQLIEQYALFVRLLRYADAEQLSEKSPYKEAISAARQQVLANAAMNYKYINILVSVDDQKKYYADNQDRYTQAKVQVLYLGFVADPTASAKEHPGKKYRKEEEAKAKIEEIRKQIKTGEDFKRLVKEYSEDETSKDKGGEFGTVRKADNIPADIKQVIFSLKPGEVSGPVQQRNGFYLFRVDSTAVEPYETVKDSIYNDLKDQRVRAWVSEQNALPVKIEDASFLGTESKIPPKE